MLIVGEPSPEPSLASRCGLDLSSWKAVTGARDSLWINCLLADDVILKCQLPLRCCRRILHQERWCFRVPAEIRSPRGSQFCTPRLNQKQNDEPSVTAPTPESRPNTIPALSASRADRLADGRRKRGFMPHGFTRFETGLSWWCFCLACGGCQTVAASLQSCSSSGW